jgi:t-SNARE complex subunit (syntaxin)
MRDNMENQHRKIKGYRELSQEEIDLMNKVKQQGIELEKVVNLLKVNSELDQRWVAIGQTDLQKGLMALVRAIAKPGFF